MKLFSQMILLLSFSALIACEGSKSTVEPKINTKAPLNEGEDSQDSHQGQGAEDSTAAINEMTYDAKAHAITLKLSYSGCAKTKHELVLNGICAESYPMQCSASLKRPKDFDGTCKMLIEEEVVLQLEKTFDTAYVRVVSNGKTSQVLVDREGKVKNLQP